MSQQLKDLILTIPAWQTLSGQELQSALLAEAITTGAIEQAKAALLLQDQKRSIYSTNAARWNQFAKTLDQWDGSGPVPEL